MVNLLNCKIVVKKFELQVCYYVNFRTNTLEKSMNFLSPTQLFPNKNDFSIKSPTIVHMPLKKRTITLFYPLLFSPSLSLRFFLPLFPFFYHTFSLLSLDFQLPSLLSSFPLFPYLFSSRSFPIPPDLFSHHLVLFMIILKYYIDDYLMSLSDDETSPI